MMNKRLVTIFHTVLLQRFLYVIFFSTAISFGSSWGAEPVTQFDTAEQREIYAQLLKDHRCLKCQNQNLADSNASIAADLRREIYEQVAAGNSRSAVSEYLVARYGDFVLYRPPFKASTYALWIGPFVLLILALAYALRLGKSNKKDGKKPSDTALQQARSLLDEDR